MTRKVEDAFESREFSEATSSVDREAIVTAVDRYLAKRNLDLKRSGTEKPQAAASSGAGEAPAAREEIQVVDFVCEDDVRRAVAQSKKIYIGPATIVTPSARDLSLQHDVLVETEQKKAMKKSASE